MSGRSATVDLSRHIEIARWLLPATAAGAFNDLPADRRQSIALAEWAFALTGASNYF